MRNPMYLCAYVFHISGTHRSQIDKQIEQRKPEVLSLYGSILLYCQTKN